MLKVLPFPRLKRSEHIGTGKKTCRNRKPIDGWDYPDETSEGASAKFWSFFKPHISVAKECGSSQDCYQTENVKYLNGSTYDYNYSSSVYYYKFVLADGGVMMLAKHGTGKCNSQSHSVPNVCSLFTM